MKIRHALLVLLAPALLAACTQQPDTAATPAASADAPQGTEQVAPAAGGESGEITPDADNGAPAEPVPDADADATEAETPAAPTPAPAVQPPAGPAPQAGKDYVEISGGQPFAATPGRIEVAEVFAYWCGHCAAFEPLVNAWKAKQPADVHFVAVPAVFNDADSFPRAFYAAETMGVLDRTHDATFNAIHIQRRLPPNASLDAIVDFYGTLGVDTAQLRSTMQSFAVNASMGRARAFGVRSGIDRTPTLVVAGKYRVTGGGSLDDTLRIADHLVAMERAAH
ncbi:thiol:disulfide interchange protein DsbA/DsbL [Luteimonas sp. BDR2-5]|uniref:thiol:disulfide interchange protein DsbA/DsbL n=1 Tax=Proluteimonas luteida TaxID=2878685 RepID=UPI001E480B24|nr:thiol:disulfide interchange protein DsbA/DsbL [Luteimonas sp. BDR2-5]MCD9029174.1 thiol:disulfide interchange protein DsbA/DsbL [Luteimonas sp. BDR2-5]